MKVAVIIEIPEDKEREIIEPLTPFEAEVKLDYGSSVLYLNGKVEEYKQ